VEETLPKTVSSRTFFERFTDGERSKIDAEAAELVAEYRTLLAIRERLGIAQREVVERLEKHQPAVSRLESQDDMRLSSLREYVEEGLGGRVRILVTGPDGVEVELTTA